MFQGGAETRLSSLKNRFYTAVPIIRQDIMAALKNKGFICWIRNQRMDTALWRPLRL